jgi:hypothetical protein
MRPFVPPERQHYLKTEPGFICKRDRIRLDTHVGSSASALGARLRQMEAVLPQFQTECESGQADQRRKVVLAGDETFFGDLLILVLMDLTSGQCR